MSREEERAGERRVPTRRDPAPSQLPGPQQRQGHAGKCRGTTEGTARSRHCQLPCQLDKVTLSSHTACSPLVGCHLGPRRPSSLCLLALSRTGPQRGAQKTSVQDGVSLCPTLDVAHRSPSSPSRSSSSSAHRRPHLARHVPATCLRCLAFRHLTHGRRGQAPEEHGRCGSPFLCARLVLEHDAPTSLDSSGWTLAESLAHFHGTVTPAPQISTHQSPAHHPHSVRPSPPHPHPRGRPRPAPPPAQSQRAKDGRARTTGRRCREDLQGGREGRKGRVRGAFGAAAGTRPACCRPLPGRGRCAAWLSQIRV